MLPDFRAIMRTRMGLGKPLEGYSLGVEGREPRPQSLGSINDFQATAPEGWVPHPTPSPAMDTAQAPTFKPDPRYEAWTPKPMDNTPTDNIMQPEGRVPKPQPGPLALRMGMKNPWQRY